MISRETSLRLSMLNVVATLLIVVMHLSYAGVNSIFACSTINYLTHCAVPAFFAMSGFFLVFSLQKYGWTGLAKSRVHTLVVPYFALNTLFIPYLFLFHNVLHAGEWRGAGLGFDWYTLSRVYGISFDMHPVCGTLWYVRCLLLFLFLSPLIVALVKGAAWKGCSLIVALWGVLIALSVIKIPAPWPDRLYSFFNVGGLLYFTIGIFLGVRYKEISTMRVPWRLVRLLSLVPLCMLLCLAYFLNSPILNGLKQMIVVWNLFVWLPAVQLPRWVVSSCFCIFALHSFFYKAYYTMLPRVGLPVLGESKIASLIPFVLTLGMCYLVAFVLRRYLPRFGGVIFGGRC